MNKSRMAVFGDAVAVGILARLDVFHNCFQYGATPVKMVRPHSDVGVDYGAHRLGLG